MSRLNQIVACLLTSALPALLSFAQDAPSQIRIRSVSLEDGLSQSTVNLIYQDRAGILWLGTQDGLNRYDGYDITTHWPDPLDETTISGKVIAAIAEDDTGRIWLATFGDGLNRYDRSKDTFEHFLHNPEDSTSIGSDMAYALLVDSNGTLWVGTAGSGVNLLARDENAFTKISIPDIDGLGEAWIYDLIEAPDGSILAATDGTGLFKLDPDAEIQERLEIIDPETGESLDDVVIEMRFDADGVLWLATPTGLMSHDIESGESRRYHNVVGDDGSLRNDWIYELEIDHLNRIWVATEAGGLDILNASRTEFTRFASDLETGVFVLPPDEIVNSLFQDEANGMWIGTESAGAVLVHQSAPVFKVFRADETTPGGVQMRDVWSVHRDRSGDLWIGTSDSGVNKLSLQTGTVVTIPTSQDDNSSAIPDGLPVSLFEDSKGRMWMGIESHGVVRSDPTKTRFTRITDRFDEEEYFSNLVPHVFMEDSRGRLWMGSFDGSLNLFHEETQEFERFMVHPDTFSAWNTIWSMAEAPNGVLWLGSLNGVVEFDPETSTVQLIPASPSDPRGLSSETVYSIHVASNDELWLGTDLGLNRMLRQTSAEENTWEFQRFTVSDGLPNDVVYAVLPGARGLLWLSTNRGLAAFDPVNLTVRSFDLADGISGYEFNQGASYRAGDGLLYFGGIGGVTEVDTKAFIESDYEPPVVVTEFRSFDQLLDVDLEDGRSLTLNHDQNFLSFTFAAIEFRSPEKIRYRYYLEGVEEEWQDAGQRRYVSYIGLSPGDYVFHVKSTKIDGLWSDSSTAISITITPPFWATWWFRLVFFTSLIMAGFTGAWIWRQAGLKKLHRAHQEKIVVQRRISDRLEAERVHLARELHDGPIQSLQYSGFQITQLSQIKGEAEQKEELSKLRSTISAVIGDLRSICGRMRPPALVHFGLGRAIQSYAERFLEKYPEIDLHLDLPEGRTQLQDRSRLGLFRICQEALSNVAKHAGPCHVTVTLKESSDVVSLEIRDDGVGFEPPQEWESLARQQHFGLLGASERADALDGKLEVYSEPGVGTTVRVEAPVSRANATPIEELQEEVLL